MVKPELLHALLRAKDMDSDAVRSTMRVFAYRFAVSLKDGRVFNLISEAHHALVDGLII
jgi:hypothetical protein